MELGILPTPTPTGTTTPATRITDSGCSVPADWPVYVIQPGNTLFSIARAVGSTVRELSEANCLEDVDTIFVGYELAVPRLPERPVATGIARVPTRTPGLASLGCTEPFAQITGPVVGQRVSGVFSVQGTAALPNLEYYKLEVRSQEATTYNFYMQSETPVTDGQLGRIDSRLFGSGVFYIRLALVDNTGNIPQGGTCVVPVIFE
jgi:hypothetical protein